jgi:hypothetical protein
MLSNPGVFETGWTSDADVCRMWSPAMKKLLTLCFVLCLFGGCQQPSSSNTVAPPPVSEVESGIERALEISQIEGVLAARGSGFTRQVAQLIGDPTDEELERIVDAVTVSFAYDSLYLDVKAFLIAEAPGGFVPTLLSWLEGGAVGQTRAIAEAYDPPVSLEEYMSEFTLEPPSVGRIQLVRELTEAQAAGDLFVLVQEALREAAHGAWSVLREDAVAFEPLTTSELQFDLTNSMAVSVMSLLHRYETVPDDLIRGAAAEWRSPSGEWYASTYGLAVAEAIRTAGERVVASLRAQPVPGLR